ncbi:MAG: redoxin domain-containing protein [Thermoplasmata archaeon]|nr:MAG: redoxin domain-containing protein [Thermoplasmata archaeon]
MSCIRLLVKTWILLVFIISLVFPPSVTAEPNVKNVIHYPENPFSFDEITVYVELNDTSNITAVKLLYCQIEPVYGCYPDILNLTLGDNNTYSIAITRDLSGVTLLGLNFTVSYIDGSKEFSPIGGQEYHYININTSDDGGTTPPCPTEGNLAMQVLIVILIIILVFLVVKHIKREDKTKPMNKKIQAVILVVFILIFVILAALFLTPGEVKKAPEFTLTDIDGNTFNLTDFRGKVVLLDMMSIPCKGCKIVEKNLKEIYPDFKDEVVFISVDILVDDTDIMLQDYRETHDINWTIARDTDDMILKYSAELIPKIIIINGDGYATFEGEVEEVSTLKKELNDAISGEAEAIAIQEASYVSLAILAGFAFFFSPCAFPMLPGYLAYYLKKGSEEGGKIPLRRAAMAGTISALGIIIVSLILGVVVIFAGTSILEGVAVLGLVVGVILIVLGGLLLTPFQYWKIVRPFQALWAKLRSIGKKKPKEGEVGAAGVSTTPGGGSGFYGGLFLYGLGYGAAAAGCTAPIFIAVLISALSAGLVFGLSVLILYNMVAAVLMISITITIAHFGAGAAQKLSQYTEVIKKISGAVLIVVGIYLLWIYFTTAS